MEYVLIPAVFVAFFWLIAKIADRYMKSRDIPSAVTCEAQKCQDASETEKDSSDDAQKGQSERRDDANVLKLKTKDLFLGTLKLLGCQYEVADEGEILFSY